MMNLAREGYNGAYFDVVDVYSVPSVQAAFNAERPGQNLREAMIDFVVRLSATVKAYNPEFKIVIQNAIALANTIPIDDPTQPLSPNWRFLNAIDGLGKESTYSLGAQFPLSWSPWDIRYVENFINAGKFVIGLEYPTTQAAQDYALQQMLAAGNYIPYFDTRLHNGNFLPVNYQVPNLVDPALINQVTGSVRMGTAIGEVIIGVATSDMINAGGGNDTVYGLDGNDRVFLGDGNDVSFGWNGNDFISGGNGNDFIGGDAGNDTLIGGDGDDGLYGWSGNDGLEGGNGNDFLMGEDGNDAIYGGAGRDTIYAGAGNDTVWGDDLESSGIDYILGDDGDDIVRAGGANDTIFGGSGGDWLMGEDGEDLIGGDAGNDAISGGNGNDRIFGWTGNDELWGDEGNDVLSGEAGEDTLIGGGGNDSLYGGADADEFRYFRETDGRVIAGVDQIFDFVRGIDKIGLAGWTPGTSFAAIQPLISVQNGSSIITFSAGNTVTLVGVTGLTAADFFFVPAT